jgi:parvulin-like peptidyl-prolyl isomerase
MYAYITRDGTAAKVPLFSDDSAKVVVALIGDEPITLADLTTALAGAHEAFVKETAAGKKDFGPILDRLIEVRLIAAEAREMGIDELADVKSAVASRRDSTGQDMLKARLLASVTPDPKEADRLYRDAVREWTVKSVLLAGELDAKQAAVKLKAPNAFDRVAAQLAAENKAKFTNQSQALPRRETLPQVVTALHKLKKGAVTDPVRVNDGFAILKVEAIRYPDDAAAKIQTRATALGNQQKRALLKFYASLVTKYAKVDRALLKRLDFEAAKPGLEALKKDRRVLASFTEGPPITVADLAEALIAGFYHGVESALKERKVNRQKEDVFDGMLSRRVVPLQVKADGLEQTEEFKRRMADYEMGIMFSKFIERAIIPKLETGEEQLKKFHAEHRGEFMYPTFYKLESLAFAKLKDAEEAVKKLRSGTDFKWLNANAEGQSKPEERKLGIAGTLAATGLTKEVADTLAGAKKGDFRLHAGEDSQFYAIHVLDVIGAKEQPFEEVREAIAQRLVNDGITGGVKKWAGLIRGARPVKIFITRIGS